MKEFDHDDEKQMEEYRLHHLQDGGLESHIRCDVVCSNQECEGD